MTWQHDVAMQGLRCHLFLYINLHVQLVMLALHEAKASSLQLQPAVNLLCHKAHVRSAPTHCCICVALCKALAADMISLACCLQRGGISDVTYPEQEARAASEARIAEQHARAQAVLAEAGTEPSPQSPIPVQDLATSEPSQNGEAPTDQALPSSSGHSSSSSRLVDDTDSTALPFTAIDDSSSAQADDLGSMPSSDARDTLEVDEAPSASERSQNGAGVPEGSYAPAALQNAAQTVAPEPGAFSDMTATPGDAASYLEIDAPATLPSKAGPEASDLAQAALAGIAARTESTSASAESTISVASGGVEHGEASHKSSLSDIATGRSSPASMDPEDHAFNEDPHQADAQPAAFSGTSEPQTEDPELEAASERHATPIRAGPGSEAETADAPGPSPAELSQAAIAGRNARSDLTPAAASHSSKSSSAVSSSASGAPEKSAGPTAEQSLGSEPLSSQSMAGQHVASSLSFQTEDAELDAAQQEAQTPQTRGADSQEWADASTASLSQTSEQEPAEAQGNGVSASEASGASAAASSSPPEVSSPAESPFMPETNGVSTASLAAAAEDGKELQVMQSKVGSAACCRGIYAS